ncbi:MAG: hypothetical protein JWO53_1033 [Chlamydiia bacterium]|nr:hypothetical protein [Chlamydiia bacterium]
MATPELAKRLRKSQNTAVHLLSEFVQMGLLREVAEQKRNKLYQFEPYLNVLEKEYESTA